MRHSYLKCPTSNSGMHYTCILSIGPTLNVLLRIAGYSTPNALLFIAVWPTPNALLCIGVSYSEYPTKYNRVSYSKCPTPYKCDLIRIDVIRTRLRIKTLFRLVQQDVIDKLRIIHKLY